MGGCRFDDGLHATPAAASTATTAAAAAALRGNVGHISRPSRRVTESAGIGPRALDRALHRPRGVSVNVSVMFPGDLVLRTRCFARYVFGKYGRSGGDKSGGRKCNDCSLHLSSSLLGAMSTVLPIVDRAAVWKFSNTDLQGPLFAGVRQAACFGAAQLTGVGRPRGEDREDLPVGAKAPAQSMG
jgi:hypothetical protein